jgi:hypothetical protein
MQQQEAAEREVDCLVEEELLGGLGYRHDLCLAGLRRRLGYVVPPGGIYVNGVDAALGADHGGQGDRDVTAPGTDIGAAPTFA